jgi:serine/threonine protein kinase/Tfp pilus assembly protein PilF
MIGSTILHYKILEKLGEGGMGIVYLAEDLNLERKVAIKFLPRHIASNSVERERFKIEAKAAAALNHPNIATIHAIEESDDDTFIVMEYIDGIELKDKIKSGPILIKAAINIAIQIAEGLEAAHKKGIVHRDIKSQNIMITNDGKVKIMDFGLAKLREGTQLTKVGSTVGTAAYMSPEQAKGEEVDNGTDIWSFGVVLYEMLTGKQPFKGDYEQAIIYSILNEKPELEGNISEALKYIVEKALAKDRKDRYQTAHEMQSDLEQLKNETFSKAYSKTSKNHPTPKKKKWIVPIVIVSFIVILTAVYFLFMNKQEETINGTRKMIVVVPFENLGPSENEYFADGLTEEITSKLSGISGLGVIARQSAMQYKKTTKSIRQIGEELGASYILQGTVRWENVGGNEHVRVTPQLIDVSEGTQIWSQASEKILSSSFKIQSEIAESVIQALDIKLAISEKQTLTADVTTNAEAYDYYLRGIAAHGKSYNEADYRIAEAMLLTAVELDPEFSRAYAELSKVHADIYWEYFDHSGSRILKAKLSAEKSLELEPNLIDGHLAMGWYYYHCKLDYTNALAEFFRALKYQTRNSDAYDGIGSVYRRQGKIQVALDYFKKAIETSPRDNILLDNVITTLILLRNYDQIYPYLQKALTLTPDWRELYTIEAWMYILKSADLEKVKMTLEKADEQNIQVETGFDIFVPIITEIANSNYQRVLELVQDMKGNACDYQFFYIPRTLFLAEIYGLMKNKKSELAYYDSARVTLEKRIKEFPGDARLYSSLGIAYAGLGEKDKAIKEGKRGVELLPISKEAWNGYYKEIDLAQIYTMVGEYDLAINKLDYLLSIPGELSVPYIKINPVWKPLFNNFRFQQVMEKYK